MLRSERALMALRTNGASCSIYRIQGSRARALQRARSSVSGISTILILHATLGLVKKMLGGSNLYQYMLPVEASIIRLH